MVLGGAPDENESTMGPAPCCGDYSIECAQRGDDARTTPPVVLWYDAAIEAVTDAACGCHQNDRGRLCGAFARQQVSMGATAGANDEVRAWSIFDRLQQLRARPK